jgi:hypothetical protein
MEFLAGLSLGRAAAQTDFVRLLLLLLLFAATRMFWCERRFIFKAAIRVIRSGCNNTVVGLLE